MNQFEIYSYGEETVVIPVEEVAEKVTGVRELAKKQIEREFGRYSDDVKVEIVSDNKARVFLPSKSIGSTAISLKSS